MEEEPPPQARVGATVTPVTGEKDARLLRTMVATRPTNRAGEPLFGRYAEVVRPGFAG